MDTFLYEHFDLNVLCKLIRHFLTHCFFLHRAVGVGALATTAFACVFIFSQIMIDSTYVTEVIHTSQGLESFFLAFGTILFAFGGASTFPTIQNDMKERHRFPLSVTVAFCGR